MCNVLYGNGVLSVFLCASGATFHCNTARAATSEQWNRLPKRTKVRYPNGSIYTAHVSYVYEFMNISVISECTRSDDTQGRASWICLPVRTGASVYGSVMSSTPKFCFWMCDFLFSKRASVVFESGTGIAETSCSGGNHYWRKEDFGLMFSFNKFVFQAG